MFDTAANININAWATEGKTQILIRWPTDQEWDERALGRKINIKRMGRGVSETIIDSLAADAKLFDKIKLNGAPDLTPAEASRIVEAIASCDAIGVEMEGNEAVVELMVPGGIVHHRLKIPSADQTLKLNRSTRVLSMPFGVQQLRIGISAGAAIWDAVGGSSDDYQGGVVPALHKDSAVRAVIDYIDREMNAATDPNF